MAIKSTHRGIVQHDTYYISVCSSVLWQGPSHVRLCGCVTCGDQEHAHMQYQHDTCCCRVCGLTGCAWLPVTRAVACQCVAVCCSVLQMLRQGPLHVSVFSASVCSSVPRCAWLPATRAVACRCVAVRCSVLQCLAECNTLQYTATPCTALRQTATHCNTLDYT